MNNLFKPLAVIGLSAIFIAGCGASDSAEPADKTTASKPAASTENSEKEQAQEDAKNEDRVVRILEQNLTFTVNGEQKEETAFLKHNDNQNYSMYVLPDYELTAEEPNRDVLFWSEDDSVFMRIELLPTGLDWASIEENTKAQLTAVDDELKEARVPEDPFFSNTWAMESSNGTDIVTSYIIKDEKQPIKLTLFTKENADHKEPFLEMAKTILKENK